MEMINKIINNQYHLINLIGEGQLSKVYIAKDLISKKTCSVKIIKNNSISDRIEDIIRYKNEYKIISKLDHQNIIKIYEVNEFENYLYLVMEYAQGISMEKYINNNKFNLYQIIDIIKQIAEALNYIHQYEIIHRDLKPGNIILNIKDNSIKVKLIDFGLAMIKQFNIISENEFIIGTFIYMSPEQCGIIKRNVDERSDLYSLGIIFYQLLTGLLPFSGKNINEIIHQHIAIEPDFKEADNNNIPIILKKIVKKLLQKEQEDRYQSAYGLMNDIDRFLNGETDFILGINDKKIKLNFKTNLIGREDEFNKIKNLFDNAMDNRGSLCIISGESGCGKTRIIEELMDYAISKDYLFIDGKCYLNTNKAPYQVVKDALNVYLNIFNKYDLNKKKLLINKFKESINDMGQILINFNSNMDEIFKDSPQLIKLDIEKENQRFLLTISNFIQNISKIDKGLVIFIDDLQWADEGSVEILYKVVQDIYDFPLLVICTYNNNEINENHVVNKFIQNCVSNQVKIFNLYIDRLDFVRLNKLIAKLLYYDEEKVKEISAFLFGKSNGNILFTIELLRQFIDEEIIYFKENKWEIDKENLNKVYIPNQIVDIILKRVSLLNNLDIDVLSYAALIGKEFNIKLLIELCTKYTDIEIVNTIDKSIKLQLVEFNHREKDKYIFIHERIQKAFYEKVSSNNEKEMHLKIAKTLENKKNYQDYIFDLAFHYYKTSDKEKILKYSYPAALKAKENYANEMAIKYLEIVISILEEKNEKGSDFWIKITIELSELYLLTANTNKAIDLYNIILVHKKTVLDRVDILEKISYAYYRKGDFINCEKYGESGLQLLGQNNYQLSFLLILSLIKEILLYIFINQHKNNYKIKKDNNNKKKYKKIIMLYYSLGSSYTFTDILKLMRVIVKMLNLSKSKIGYSKELAKSFFGFGVLCSAIPLYKLSMSFFKKAFGCYRKMNDKWGIAITNQQLAYLYLYNGEYLKSINCFKFALNIFNKIGDLKEYAITINGIGYCYYLLSDYNKFNYYTDLIFNLSNKINDNYTILVSYCFYLILYNETGDFKNIENIINKLQNLLKEKQIVFLKFLTNFYIGKLKLLKNEFNEALKNFNEALELNKNNNLFQAYVVELYPNLAELYLLKFIEEFNNKNPVLNKSLNKSEKKQLKQIKYYCNLSIKKTKNWTSHYGGALRVYAQYYALIKKTSKARKYFIKSLQHCEKIGRKYELAKSLFEYGIFLKNIGDDTISISKIESAYNIFTEIKSRFYIDKINKLLKIGESPSAIERMIDRQKLSMIIKLSQDISSILSIDELMNLIIQKSIEVIGAKRGYLFLLNEKKNQLELKASFGESDIEKTQYSMSIVNDVLNKKEIIITTDAEHDENLNVYHSVRLKHLKSVICMPMKIRDKIIGACYFDNPLTRGVFTKESSDLLDVFIAQASINIENALLYQNLELKVNERTKELNLAKEAADKANSAKSNFLAKISHDIRTPLHAIIGFSELINKKIDDEKIKDYNKKVINESEHLLNLINLLLDLSKIEAGKFVIDKKKFNLIELVNSTVKTFEVLCATKELYLNVNIDKNINCNLIGDSLRLHQILMNLIGNAVKFTINGGITIDINIIEQDENKLKVIFKITDTGIGISDEMKKNIFVEYVQDIKIMNNNYTGTGLGTTISKQLVELMGGQIDFISEENKGTKFWFILEFQKTKDSLDKNLINDSDVDFNNLFKNFSLLLVEDNKINQEIAISYLSQTGCKITIADNGFSAVEKAENNKFDLILMDIQLPKMNGFEAAKKIRLFNNTIKIVGMTANAFNNDINQCLIVGMNDVITKPIRKKDFLKKIYSIFIDLLSPKKVNNNGINIDQIIEKENINYDKLMIDFNNNKQLVNQLIKELIEMSKISLDIIYKAFNEKKYEIIKFETHKLKGASFNLTAQKFGKIVEQLENMGKTQNFNNFENLINEYKNELNKINLFLNSKQ